MKANQAAHSIATMCRVLGVSASGYYAWQGRGVSARHGRIERWWSRSEHSIGSRGAPTGRRGFTRDLRDAGVRVGRKRVARLLTQAGLRGVSRRKWP
jgi:putative transposase